MKSFFNRGVANQRSTDKPLFFISSNHPPEDESNQNANQFTTNPEPNCCFAGWKLYFPKKSFKESFDLVSRIRAIEKHFSNYSQFYDTTVIEETQELVLKLEILSEDGQLAEDWPSFYEDIKLKTTQALACIGLAMHNIIVNSQGIDNQSNLRHRKIFTRPYGFENHIDFASAAQTTDQLICITGTVFHMDPVELNFKMVCFRCASCSTEMVVKQNPGIRTYVYPSSCSKGCPARGRFIKLGESPYTIIQPKRMIGLMENVTKGSDDGKLNVELTQNHAELVTVGVTVTITGVVKHRNEKKHLKKGEGKFLKTYLKCFAIDVHNRLAPLKYSLNDTNRDFINLIKSESSIFRILVHSLCPSIFGREEVKAGLLLGLLSGRNIMPQLRSESHVLLVGNPGVGKSKMLQACTEVSEKGIFVNGPTSTGVGLTAKINSDGSIDAGALILADEGVCCIDEFDKMKSYSHVLLEAMEQQVISITKRGVMNNSPCRASIIAAANPTSSFYDKSKTIIQNLKISPQLLSRFDLVFPLSNHGRNADQNFLAHTSGRNTIENGRNSFFSQSSTTSNFSMMNRNKNLNWLRTDQEEKIETLSVQQLKVFLEYARKNIKPQITPEAQDEIRKFFKELRMLTLGEDMPRITFRYLEGLLRLTLSRARADLEIYATREHAIDVINLVKFSMSDIYSADDPSPFPSSSTSGGPPAKKQAVSVASMSKPKQMKVYLEHLREAVETKQRNLFSSDEMKEMAKEIGIRDHAEIIDKLNLDCFLLKTVDGYKVLS